jgi:hypothetical protein
MRDRLLIRHFLRRFLEHDLISPNADRHEVLSAIGGTLVAVSLFMLSVGMRTFDRASIGPAVALDLDEQPPLPTQLLNLAE